MDACSRDARDELIAWFCDRELEDYVKLFGVSEDAGQLEFAVQRFKWLRQKLHVYTQSYVSVFPAKWYILSVFPCVFYIDSAKGVLLGALPARSASAHVAT
jgi:hypothetical protein